MKKPAIPSASTGTTPDQARFNAAIKENIEVIVGGRGSRIKPLPSDAGLTDIVAKINELLSIVQ